MYDRNYHQSVRLQIHVSSSNNFTQLSNVNMVQLSKRLTFFNYPKFSILTYREFCLVLLKIMCDCEIDKG